MSAILVVAGHRRGALRDSTFETLGAAQALARDTGDTIEAALLSDAPRDVLEPIRGLADRVHLVEHPDLADFETEAVLAVLTPLVERLAPRVVLMAHDSQGMDLAPALAGRLGHPLVTDCTALAMPSGGGLEIRRAPYGGKLVETLTLKPAPTTHLTIQGGAFDAPAAGTHDTAVIEVDHGGVAKRHARRFLRYVDAEMQDVDITASDILVSVGRGIGSPENVALAEALADAVGGVVSCSRPVADAGWLPQSRQVGTSGQTVRPKLYIALGISGAFQHLAGMRGSETILAVNKDPRAPIFGVASYGIVGDVLEVLPALTKELGG